MKKLVVVIGMMSLTFAQDSGMSLYGGLNYANMSYEDVEYKASPSYLLGVQKNMGSFLLGVGISGRGAKMDYPMLDELGSSGTIETTLKFTYLDVHAMKTFPAGPGALFAALGIGVNLSAKMEVLGIEADIEDVGLDYGVNLGYSFPLNEKMSIFASYYLGLAPINDSSDSPTHNGIGLGVGYGL